jgi:hypothetical protein
MPDKVESGRVDPPPHPIRYPAAVRFVWRSMVAGTIGGASLGFGTFAVAFNPDSPVGYISFALGAVTAVLNLTKGVRIAANHAFFCGQADGAYRFALTLQGAKPGETVTVDFDTEYPEDE